MAGAPRLAEGGVEAVGLWLLEDGEPMTLAEVEQAGTETQQPSGPPQMAAVLWLIEEEQHTEVGVLGQAEAVPGLGLLAVSVVLFERAALEYDLQEGPAVRAPVVSSVFEWDEQMVC